MNVFFFFSSRRRHTRWPRDWSSDVCSSDLDERRDGEDARVKVELQDLEDLDGQRHVVRRGEEDRDRHVAERDDEGVEIGRASCRERGKMKVVVAKIQRKSCAAKCTPRRRRV